MGENYNISNILICGSPRVGKSCLINAICRKELSKSNTSLNSSTKNIQKYSARTVVGHITHETNFWDTPGIESWNENDVRSYMASLIEETHPLCMIYCASPGSFAVLDHVTWMISECHRKNIFCALVCTNMWAGRNRQNIVNEFCKLLNIVHPQIKSSEEDGIIYYDRVALVTMVNSTQHVDEDFGVTKPPSGVNELIFGIAKCLERDFMFAWLRTVSENKSFWTTMSSKLCNLIKVPYEKFNNLFERVENFLDLLIGDSEFNYDENTFLPLDPNMSIDHNAQSISRTAMNEPIFYDAEIIEIPSSLKSKQLLFTLNSQDMVAQINNALIQLGATKIKNRVSDETNQSKFFITAEFQDDKNLKAIYDIWQVISQTEVNCTIVDDSFADSKSDIL
ncbi:unnamed protein product [Rotaria sordida]|uniref:G domain-containing protein n=1 Tax=Rotaria sordida TaxID=392033 RepID=A0A814BB02_9BILA|nr:unnamed protein product [Rotaria sordida]CAF0926905.1 unnamed protein product [Rotaria sordida]